jgi:hypothetical protein
VKWRAEEDHAAGIVGDNGDVVRFGPQCAFDDQLDKGFEYLSRAKEGGY